MLFNSPVYIFLFLPLVVISYFAFNRYRLILPAKIWLVCASLFFYGYWNYHYLLLIAVSILINFFLSSLLSSQPILNNEPLYSRLKFNRKKSILLGGIFFNLGLLGYFKYTDFFIENINLFLSSEFPLLNLALPLAISFFTFQQIAYLTDIYYGKTSKHNFLDYCLFVTFFPQLIAGPIVHYKEMMPQFRSVRAKLMHWRHIVAGCFIFSIGLFKKVVLADTFAVWADAGFAAQAPLNIIEAWTTSLSFTLQLYYDFSGYTDMAIGAALLFNIHLPVNFNSPYQARNIQDFWRRWHMTLSRWLKDYVYIPLGGNRNGKIRMHINLLLTFILGGLWHGAGWTFVIWGALHGIALSFHRIWQYFGLGLPAWLAWLCTFLFINFTWVFFRAETLDSALEICKSMLDIHSFNLSLAFLDQLSAITKLSLHPLFISSAANPMVSEWGLGAAIFAIILVATTRNTNHIKHRLLRQSHWLTWPKLILLSIITSLGVLTLLTSSSSVFLYFNF